jgi:hypothetical protein
VQAGFRKYHLECELMFTVAELFDLGLEIDPARAEGLLDEAEQRMKRADADNEVWQVLRDNDKMTAAMVVSGGYDDKNRRELVTTTLKLLSYAVDTNTGLSKAAGRLVTFHAMSPLTGPVTGARPEALVTRAMIKALGLTEVATAIWAFIYLNDTFTERRGNLVWRRAQAGKATDETAQS